MSGFPILDLVVGMIFIFFLLSIISSSMVEIVLSYFKIRSKVLTKWLLTIFDKQMIQPDGKTVSLGHALMDHCLTTALAKAGKATSFMDAKNFSSALIEKLTFDAANPAFNAKTLDEIIQRIESATALNGTPLLSTELQRTIILFANEAKQEVLAVEKKKSEIELFRKKIEDWFDTSMDRIQGHMKSRYVRPITFVVAVGVALGLNADSIAISRYLYSNPSARAKVVAEAYKTAQDTEVQKRLQRMTADSTTRDVALELKEKQDQLEVDMGTLRDTGIPLGWDHVKSDETVLTRIAGWFATILAIMLGAPFWFDLLNKISNLRGTGPRPPSSTDKAKKD